MLALGVPASFIDASLTHVKEALQLSLRVSLTNYFSERYLARNVFFRIAGLRAVSDVNLKITDTIEQWCNTVTTALTVFTRSGLEAIVFSREMKRLAGFTGLFYTWLFYGAFSLYSFRFAPSVDELTTLRVEKLGDFRAAHQNVRMFAEEFSVGDKTVVKQIISKLFQRLTNHARIASYLHCVFQLGNVAIFRYGTAALSVLIGALTLQKNSSSVAITMRNYSRSTHTFNVLSSALNRLLATSRLLKAVRGHTESLHQFIEGLDYVEQDISFSHISVGDKSPHMVPQSPSASMLSIGSTFDSCVTQGCHVEFIDVPLTLPSGKCLCKSLTFRVLKDMSLLITGPNGCGKSSTLRLLGELWPLQGGILIKPPAEELYYLPQQPYMFDGTLLEQIIYPHQVSEMMKSTDELLELLKVVGLDHLITSPQSWETSIDSLSIGVRQRIAFARLCYHRPSFAILDECSSYMDPATEAAAYQHCQKLNISLITVAHRRSVWKYHNYVLRFDGLGGYVFSPLVVDSDNQLIRLTCIESSSDSEMLGNSLTLGFAALSFDNAPE